MRRKLLSLLSVFALLLVAAGGAAAAGDAGTNISTPPEQTADSGIDAGICLAGADSPCNDAPADDPSADGELHERNTSDEDGKMHIPEDQNRDGAIDDRFGGDAVAELFAVLTHPFAGSF